MHESKRENIFPFCDYILEIFFDLLVSIHLNFNLMH